MAKRRKHKHCTACGLRVRNTGIHAVLRVDACVRLILLALDKTALHRFMTAMIDDVRELESCPLDPMLWAALLESHFGGYPDDSTIRLCMEKRGHALYEPSWCSLNACRNARLFARSLYDWQRFHDLVSVQMEASMNRNNGRRVEAYMSPATMYLSDPREEIRGMLFNLNHDAVAHRQDVFYETITAWKGPLYSGHTKCMHRLEDMYIRLLANAFTSRAMSVAIHPLSSGDFQVPVTTDARMCTTTLLAFFRVHPQWKTQIILVCETEEQQRAFTARRASTLIALNKRE